MIEAGRRIEEVLESGNLPQVYCAHLRQQHLPDLTKTLIKMRTEEEKLNYIKETPHYFFLWLEYQKKKGAIRLIDNGENMF